MNPAKKKNRIRVIHGFHHVMSSPAYANRLIITKGLARKYIDDVTNSDASTVALPQGQHIALPHSRRQSLA